ncbi:MAG: stage II sporulation protein E [Defluviitaleaceae bacterium]|nr:stage II sporulation protein E [Defluviitaleaceae bacterium]
MRAAQRERKKVHLNKQDIITAMVGVMGLFLGRVAIFGTINPVAIAFLSTYILRGYRIYFAAIFITIGVFTRFSNAYFFKYTLAISLIIFVHFFSSKMEIRVTKNSKAIISSISILIFGILVNLFLDRGMYYFFLVFLESIMAFGLVFIMDKGIKVLEGKHLELDNESLLSAAIILALLVSGVSDIYISNISLKHIFSSLAVLVVANKGNGMTSATAGVVLGLILTITNATTGSFIGILSVSGMISGISKTIKGNILGFAFGWIIMSLFLDTSFINFGILVSITLGCILLIAAPKPELTKSKEINFKYEHLEKSKDYISKRLWKFNSTFLKISSNFEDIEKKYTITTKEHSDIIDNIANATCLNCHKRDICWDTQKFYNTYDSIKNIVDIYEKNGESSINIQSINNFCVRPDLMISNINHIYRFYKNNINWKNRIIETRELVSQQFREVGYTLKNFANDIENNLKFIPYLENKILVELEKNKIEVDSVIVMENSIGKCEVEIKYRGSRKILSKVKDIVSNVIGKKMIESPNIQSYKIHLVEEQNFRISTGIAKATKENAPKSGDSHCVMHISDGNALIMLSDGMGSGYKAHEESATTLEIFEELIETGFQKETAIKILNSVMILKNDDEYFSTLDACFFNMYSGYCDFIKMGSSSTYIKNDEGVSIIKNSDLPIGIINEINVDIVKRKMKKGDLIIMITDGIETQETKEENNLTKILENTDIKDPIELANYILEKVKEKSNILRDDMTVLVAKVLKR